MGGEAGSGSGAAALDATPSLMPDGAHAIPTPAAARETARRPCGDAPALCAKTCLALVADCPSKTAPAYCLRMASLFREQAPCNVCAPFVHCAKKAERA